MQKHWWPLFFFVFLSALADGQSRVTKAFTEGWSFLKGSFSSPQSALAASGWTTVSIPHTWNNVDMQEGPDYYRGDGWYRKALAVDSAMLGRRLFLRFEGVGQVADLYVNGHLVGEHKGAYAAFCMEITHFLRKDTVNTIVLKANNEARKDVIPINDRLFGVYGGMYRPVQLILTSRINITTTDYASPGIYIRQDSVSSGAAFVRVLAKIENREDQSVQEWVETIVRDSAGNTVATDRRRVTLLPQGMNRVEAALRVEHPRLWNGKTDPYLYNVTVSLQDGDAVSQPLGLRTFRIVPGQGFFLNGRPYRLYGVCRHQEWEGSGSALTNEQHRTDLDLISEIGATSIRFAHYQQAEFIYSTCDSMGFVVWAEIPFVNAWSGQEDANACQQLTELIRQNYNHPSIYVWGLHNEVYSQTEDGYVPVLTRRLNDLAKTEDPDRYTVSTSGYGEMDRPSNRNADIQAMNRYYGWYEGRTGDLDKWVDGMEREYPLAKTVLSEYGCEANTHQHTQNVADTGNPAAQFWPEDYQTAFHETQWGIISRHPYLIASYAWNMFDFCVPGAHGGGVQARNMKGLVTYDRHVKKDAFYWYKANWNPGPVLYIAGRRDSLRTSALTTVKVFAHMDEVHLYVNGKRQRPYRQGTTSADCLFERVRLRKGVNEIRATGVFKGGAFEDRVRWVLQ